MCRAAETNRSHTSNRAAFNRYDFVPRVFVDISKRDAGVELFGRRYDAPFGIAPMGLAVVPIAIDGMVVHPGDLILGDSDGVLRVPFADAARVLEAAQAKVALEEKTLANIKAGKHDTSWIDATLKRIGCDPEPR